MKQHVSRKAMRPAHCVVLLSAAFALPVAAKLPAPSDEAKAATAAAAHKAAWNDKVAAYKLCLAQDRVAAAYKKSPAAAGKDVAAMQTAAAASGAAPAPISTPACADPGPYVALTPTTEKPLEAAGAHSPAGTATSPPNTKATSAQMEPAPKGK
jgi:hypothetical protein